MAALRTLTVRGSFHMALRQVAGMAISLFGLLALARLIGPAAYGTYAAAFAIYTYCHLLSVWGIDVYLVRKKDELTPEDQHQALTLLVLGGIIAAAAALVLSGPLEQWVGVPGLRMALVALFCGLPVQLLAVVPTATIERTMNYRRVAWIELSGQAALYIVAVALAAAGWGLAAPLAGWWAQQVLVVVLLYRISGYRPRPIWRPALVRAIVGYGIGFASSVWVWQLRLLVNPLVVAKTLGPEAAATVAIAIRLVEALSFMRNVIWRVSIAAMGRIQTDRGRIAAAVADGMRIQVLAVGLAMVSFSLIAAWLIPLAFGRDWSAVATIFPFVAAGYLVNAVFSLHSSALYVLGRNWDVTLFHLVHVALFAGAAILLVPRIGLLGYGWAELAALAGYVVIHVLANRALGALEVGLCLAWALGLALPLFAPILGLWVWLGPALVLALPDTWKTARRYVKAIQELRHA